MAGGEDVDEPAVTHRRPTAAGRVDQFGGEPLDAPYPRETIDVDPAFGEELRHVPV